MTRCSPAATRSSASAATPTRPALAKPGVDWHRWEPTLERPADAAFDGVDARRQPGRREDQPALDRRGEARRSWRPAAPAPTTWSARSPASSSGPAVLVSQSAVGYYGDRGDAVVDESDGPGGESFDSEVVVEWEQAAREAEAAGAAPGDRPHRPGARRRAAACWPSSCPRSSSASAARSPAAPSTSPGSTSTTRSGSSRALDDEKVSGALNATAPEPATNRDFSKALGRALGRPAVLPVPGFVLDLKFGSEFGEVLRGGQRAVPKRTLELGYEFQHPRLDEALGTCSSRRCAPTPALGLVQALRAPTPAASPSPRRRDRVEQTAAIAAAPELAATQAIAGCFEDRPGEAVGGAGRLRDRRRWPSPRSRGGRWPRPRPGPGARRGRRSGGRRPGPATSPAARPRSRQAGARPPRTAAPPT